MVKHIVMWNFNPEMSVEEKKAAGEKMKALLEPIKELVEGAVDIRVVINDMESSNRDIALIGTYKNEDALKAYQVHPAHVEAGKFVRSVTCNRSCLDYEE